jgi:anti-sigma factor RsiW
MAISPKMRAIIEKVDAADAAYSAGLHAIAREEAEAREKLRLEREVRAGAARTRRPVGRRSR